MATPKKSPKSQAQPRPSTQLPGAKESTKSHADRNRENERATSGLDLGIEHRAVDKLIPSVRNARTHSDAQVAQIAASIGEFGWTNPILVDQNNSVIAGHGRLLAARKIGLKTVPVIELSGLSAATKRAYLLADNKLALNAGWDEELLAAEVADLVALGVDIGKAGFDSIEVDRLVDLYRGAASSFPDDAPALPATAISRPGDVWLLGEHRLLCGDATRPEDLERVMAGSRADMVFTDPPYNVAYEGKTARRMTIANDALGVEFKTFLKHACCGLLQRCDGAIYICMSSSELGTLKATFEEAGGHWSTFVMWAKSTFTLGRSDYHRQYEPILYGWRKGGEHYWCGARNQGDVWEFPRPTRNDLHPTMKPVALVERAIRNSSKPKGLILDPFAGSGSTLMAAEAAGRRAALIEIDPAYCDVIVRRYQEATTKSAIHELDKLSYQQVAENRGVRE